MLEFVGSLNPGETTVNLQFNVYGGVDTGEAEKMEPAGSNGS